MGLKTLRLFLLQHPSPGNMPKKRKTLAHAEVWDDTALVQSWEDALEEYKVRAPPSHTLICLLTFSKLYHSIHAKGERVEDVIKSAEREDREINGDANGVSVTGEEGEAVEDRNEGLEDGELEDGELEEEPVNGDVLDGTAREVSIQVAAQMYRQWLR